MSCSSNDAEKLDRPETPPDTLLADDFYFFSSANAFLDSSYNVFVLLSEGNDIPVLPVKDSYHVFREKATLFIDARDPEEYDAGHIPDAINIARLEKAGDVWRQDREVVHLFIIDLFSVVSDTGFIQVPSFFCKNLFFCNLSTF